jgi:hypothetical protein
VAPAHDDVPVREEALGLPRVVDLFTLTATLEGVTELDRLDAGRQPDLEAGVAERPPA